MSEMALFLAGVCVTLIWSAGIGSLLWAAWEGAKEEKRRKEALEE
jgi:hypothetical protein